MIYVYDGSFEGLLTCIYEAYYRKQRPLRIESKNDQQVRLLEEYAHIDTNGEKSGKVYNSICEKISYESLEHAYHVFLSENPDAGTLIYDYLELGWRMGSKLDMMHSDDRVLRVHVISRQVELERHRLLGFVRFRLLGEGVFYAAIRPDNNIVELLAPHFAARLSDQCWILHDEARHKAVFYSVNEWVVTEFDMEAPLQDIQEEKEYSQLWKGFFNSILIKSRENPKLQKRLMPRRYWQNLTEMN